VGYVEGVPDAKFDGAVDPDGANDGTDDGVAVGVQKAHAVGLSPGHSGFACDGHNVPVNI